MQHALQAIVDSIAGHIPLPVSLTDLLHGNETSRAAAAIMLHDKGFLPQDWVVTAIVLRSRTHRGDARDRLFGFGVEPPIPRASAPYRTRLPHPKAGRPRDVESKAPSTRVKPSCQRSSEF
jgi:hypothetical protein